MDKSTKGIAIFFIGLIAFLESFKLAFTERIVYMVVGICLIVGGLFYASRKE